MIIIVSLIYTVFVALYFGLFRLIDYMDFKKKELVQFFMIYAVLLAIMAYLSFIFTKDYNGEYWHLHFEPIRKQVFTALFYVPPTFGIAYLLYPFKIIKRNWTLLCYTLIFVLSYVGINLFWIGLDNM